MNPRNDAAILYAQGEITLEEYYRRDQIRIKDLNAAARGLSLKRDHAYETAPDGRLLHNPNPVEKRFFND